MCYLCGQENNTTPDYNGLHRYCNQNILQDYTSIHITEQFVNPRQNIFFYSIYQWKTPTKLLSIRVAKLSMQTWSLHSRILQFLWENIISLLTYQRISADVWKYFGCVPMNFGYVPMAVRRKNRILLQGFPYHKLHVRKEGNLLSSMQFDSSTACDATSREKRECETDLMIHYTFFFYKNTLYKNK